MLKRLSSFLKIQILQNFYVKIEAGQRLESTMLSSKGGLRIFTQTKSWYQAIEDGHRGIPLHLWNTETFIQIGNACRGLIKIAKRHEVALNLIEVDIKVRYNYLSFLPAFIGITNKEGKKIPNPNNCSIRRKMDHREKCSHPQYF